MPELRWNPLLATWTLSAANRQARPNLSSGACPFCPGSGKVPERYDVLAYDNDFPALSLDVPVITSVPALQGTAPAYGKCEIILYTPIHTQTFGELSAEQAVKVVQLWQQRSVELSRVPGIEYVFIFENRGPEVGATMLHPHGQLYAYPFVPLKLERELVNCERYLQLRGKCLVCELNEQELQTSQRVIAEHEHFIVYLPHFTEYPFGVFVSPKRHFSQLDALRPLELQELGRVLRDLVAAFDRIYDRPFPYMMCLHQGPASLSRSGAPSGFHFHIEFYPPLRSKDALKWNASSETGAWASGNPVAPEEATKILKPIYQEVSTKGISV